MALYALRNSACLFRMSVKWFCAFEMAACQYNTVWEKLIEAAAIMVEFIRVRV
jgi:hypothetical protein